MSSPDPTLLRECVCPGEDRGLFKQDIHGEIRIVDPWKVSGEENFLKVFEAAHQRNDYPSPAKILAVYTSEKDVKTNSLRTLLKSIVYHKVPAFSGMIEEALFKEVMYKTSLSETKVGKQPFAPYGQLGNLYRIQEAQDNLLRDLQINQDGLKEQKNKLGDYLAVFILSIESDIDDKRHDLTGAVPHDQPNMMIYECFSGDYISAVGRGPGVQKNILDIVKRQGFLDENGPQLAGKVEYGSQVAIMFGTNGQPIDPSNWHNAVSYHNREHHFKDLSAKILSEAKIKFSQKDTPFHFHLPDKP